MSQNKSNVILDLPKNKKNTVILGSSILLFFLMSTGPTIAVFQSVLLENMNALQHFPLLTVFASVGTTLMTPIGGKLNNMFGHKKVLTISCIGCILSLLGMAFSTTFVLFFFFRVLLGFCLGAFVSTPYVMARLVNEPKNVPKTMGLFATFTALGTMIGPFVAGILSGKGYFSQIFIFLCIFPLVAIPMFLFGLPNTRSDKRPKMDWVGIAILTALLVSFVLPMTYGSKIGWTDPKIIGGLILMVVLLAVFIKYENGLEKKGKSPIIAMSLFKNKKYTSVVLAGACFFIFTAAMTNYGSLGAIKVLNAPLEVTGALFLPRTIVTMFLPAITGVWVSKSNDRTWKGMVITGFLIALACIPIVFITPSMSIVVLFVCFGITGVAESFRSVTVTPSAQNMLEPKDLSTGTALINFCNSLAVVLASTLYGSIYNAFSQGRTDFQMSIRAVFAIAGFFPLLGALITLFFVRKHYANEDSEKAAEAVIETT